MSRPGLDFQQFQAQVHATQRQFLAAEHAGLAAGLTQLRARFDAAR